MPVPSAPNLENLDELDCSGVERKATCDQETFTDPYDFNMIYIGATDEYKIIIPRNRKSINEHNISPVGECKLIFTRRVKLRFTDLVKTLLGHFF